MIANLIFLYKAVNGDTSIKNRTKEEKQKRNKTGLTIGAITVLIVVSTTPREFLIGFFLESQVQDSSNLLLFNLMFSVLPTAHFYILIMTNKQFIKEFNAFFEDFKNIILRRSRVNVAFQKK